MPDHRVQVGEEMYTIQRFRGLKAILAMAAMTRVARQVPDMMAEAVKQYQRKNTITITEAMARLPRWSGFSKEDFDAAEASTGKREIELGAPMTANEQIMYALPQLLEEARKEVTRLLALLIVPNSELREADKEDKVEDVLDKYQDTLMYEAEIDQLVDLLFAAQDTLKEQLEDRGDRLGKLMSRLWNLVQRNQNGPQVLQTSQQPTTDLESTPQTSTQESPTSSTGLDAPTDGTETQPSMASLGANS